MYLALEDAYLRAEGLLNDNDARYTPFKRGTSVLVQVKGQWIAGKVTAIELNPNRKPGRGRVSYTVRIHPAYFPRSYAADKVLQIV